MLSVIIPAYNEGENINHASEVISKLLKDIDFEIIFSNDGSKDNTWELIKENAARNPRIRGLHFSRNFGKEAAIFAGLEKARGDCAVVIDCDLQHPPELILDMYDLWEQGYEVVEARKASRGKESVLYKTFAKTFYRIMKRSSGLNLDGASDYKLLDRKVIDSLNAMEERLTFFRALSAWVGFKTATVEFEVRPRVHGKTKWNYGNLFKFAFSSVTGFTNYPMHLMTVFGVVFMILTLVLGAHTLANFFAGRSAVGFPTVILLLLIIGSLLMLGLGIIGYYLSKIYEEIKFRPRYIINEEIDGKTGEKKENEQNQAS